MCSSSNYDLFSNSTLDCFHNIYSNSEGSFLRQHLVWVHYPMGVQQALDISHQFHCCRRLCEMDGVVLHLTQPAITRFGVDVTIWWKCYVHSACNGAGGKQTSKTYFDYNAGMKIDC